MKSRERSHRGSSWSAAKSVQWTSPPGRTRGKIAVKKSSPPTPPPPPPPSSSAEASTAPSRSPHRFDFGLGATTRSKRCCLRVPAASSAALRRARSSRTSDSTTRTRSAATSPADRRSTSRLRRRQATAVAFISTATTSAASVRLARWSASGPQPEKSTRIRSPGATHLHRRNRSRNSRGEKKHASRSTTMRTPASTCVVSSGARARPARSLRGSAGARSAEEHMFAAISGATTTLIFRFVFKTWSPTAAIPVGPRVS
mmetsp:Transcript_17154/g.57956  ORF Transcript_17154/g.57956 Transcript_17154/m.57956 type:complete len:258 (-) Transcript_17154:873-1646(-)